MSTENIPEAMFLNELAPGIAEEIELRGIKNFDGSFIFLKSRLKDILCACQPVNRRERLRGMQVHDYFMQVAIREYNTLGAYLYGLTADTSICVEDGEYGGGGGRIQIIQNKLIVDDECPDFGKYNREDVENHLMYHMGRVRPEMRVEVR